MTHLQRRKAHTDFQAQPEAYDLLIFGSGAGSKLLAWTFAGRGQRVAVVERKYVGGSCPNIAQSESRKPLANASRRRRSL
jgi:pyruvate/2-oxoglutarate dehydrogenase complex dihydrolipoamide dehydrogenase (E3) component